MQTKKTRIACVTMTAVLATAARALAVGCDASNTLPGDASPSPGGPQSSEDAGATASSNPVPDAGKGADAGSVVTEDAGSGAMADAGGSAPDAGKQGDDAGHVTACASNASISTILSQFGSDSTDSTVTPMGTRFETAAKTLPISATNKTFLATPSSNPDVAQATSATGLSWQKVSVNLYPSGAPSPEDIMQHAIGDCDGDSALASMAYVNPALVESLITDNGDGTYSVAMFDPMGVPVTVLVDSQVLVDQSDPNLGQVSANDGSADWATVLEKAVMKYDYAYDMVGQLDGIGSETLIPMFTGTGGSIAISPGSLTPAQLQEVVTVSLAAGKFITSGFNQDGLTIGQDETVTAHGYAAMVPGDPSTYMIDMRNPWGVNPWASGSSNSGYDTSTDGLLQIPLATSPDDWPQIIDLRIIDPGPECSGVTTPFTPKVRHGMSAPVHITEPHALAHARRAH